MSAGAAGSGGWEGRWVGVAPWCAVARRGVPWRQQRRGGVSEVLLRAERGVERGAVTASASASAGRRAGARTASGPRGKRTAAMAAPPSLPQPPQTAPLSPPSRPVGSAVVRHPWRRTAAATTQNSLVFFFPHPGGGAGRSGLRVGTPVVWVRPQVGGRRWLRVAHGCSTWFSGCLSRASSRFFKPAWLLRFSRRAMMVPVAYQLAMALAHGTAHARCSLVEPRQGIRRESREHRQRDPRSCDAGRADELDCAGSEQFPPHD